MLRSIYAIFVRFITTQKCSIWKNYCKQHPNLWTEMHRKFYSPKTFLFYPAMLWWNLLAEIHSVQMKWISLKAWSIWTRSCYAILLQITSLWNFRIRFYRKFIFDYNGSYRDIPASAWRCRASGHSFHIGWQWYWKHFFFEK